MLKHWLGLATAALSFFGTISQSAIIGRDERMTFPAFAEKAGRSLAEARQRYAATVAVACLDRDGRTRLASGAVIERDDLVLTVAHLMMGPQGPHVASTEDCKVYVHDGASWQPHDIDQWSVVAGSRRISAPDMAPHYDWLALKLMQPLEHVTPYRLDPALADAGSLAGRHVLNSAASHQNFKVNGQNVTLSQQAALAPVMGLCSIRDTMTQPQGGALLHSDCDTGVWASGSPLLVDEGETPAVAGMIISGGLESRSGTAYDPRLNASVAIHMSGPVLAALRGLQVVAARAALPKR